MPDTNIVEEKGQELVDTLREYLSKRPSLAEALKDYATIAYVDANKFQFQIVETLPTGDDIDENTFYLKEINSQYTIYDSSPLQPIVQTTMFENAPYESGTVRFQLNASALVYAATHEILTVNDNTDTIVLTLTTEKVTNNDVDSYYISVNGTKTNILWGGNGEGVARPLTLVYDFDNQELTLSRKISDGTTASQTISLAIASMKSCTIYGTEGIGGGGSRMMFNCYLIVPSTTAGQNLYECFFYTNDVWNSLGTTAGGAAAETDMSGYLSLDGGIVDGSVEITQELTVDGESNFNAPMNINNTSLNVDIGDIAVDEGNVSISSGNIIITGTLADNTGKITAREIKATIYKDSNNDEIIASDEFTTAQMNTLINLLNS